MKHIITLSMIFGLTNVHASNESIAWSPNIMSGNMKWGGSLNLSQENRNGYSLSNTEVSLDYQFFVLDQLSIGVAGGFERSEAQVGEFSNVGTLGPVATYHLSNQGRLIPYFSTTYRFGLTEETVAGLWRGELGLSVFINSNVAFSPCFYFTRYFSKFEGQNFQRYGFAAGFDFYL